MDYKMSDDSRVEHSENCDKCNRKQDEIDILENRNKTSTNETYRKSRTDTLCEEMESCFINSHVD